MIPEKESLPSFDLLTHPGLAFSQGYLPGQKPRQVVETHQELRAKIAGEVGFKPVTKIQLPDRDVYVRAVKNTHTRAVSPSILGTSGSISIKGEPQVGLTPKLHSEIKAKASSAFEALTKPSAETGAYVNSHDLETQAIKPRPVVSQEALNSNHQFNDQIKSQLDDVNKLLFEQIKQRVAEEITRQKTPNQEATTLSSSESPKLAFAKPVTVSTADQNQPQEAETSLELASQPITKKSRGVVPLVTLSADNYADYQKHIVKLEEEIKALVKEVVDLDRTFNLARGPSQSQEIFSLKERVDVDERLLKAAENWRRALTNLINSHSLALKHLKQKTDSLEEKTKGVKYPHQAKHETHHQPGVEPKFDFAKLHTEKPLPEAPKTVLVIPSEELKPPVGPESKQSPSPIIVQVEKPPLEVSSQSFESVRDLLRHLEEKGKPSTPPAVPTESVPKLPQEPAKSATSQEGALPISQRVEPLSPPSKPEVTQPLKIAVPPPLEVSPEDLKPSFQQLKTALANLDPQTLKQLSQQQRKEMLEKFEALERDNNVLKQFSELQAVQEKRRINDELQKLFSQLKPQAVPTESTQERIETLKEAGKKFTSPEDKARVIAEIKDLARREQAKKARAVTKPTVKATPAYGKMLPNTPNVPNVINGIIKDANGLLLSGVVIIVKNKDGEPVRAFRPNKLGQFALSTPLPNGIYTLELEKAGYEFDIIEVEASGSVMQPIEIKAKNINTPVSAR